MFSTRATPGGDFVVEAWEVLIVGRSPRRRTGRPVVWSTTFVGTSRSTAAGGCARIMSRVTSHRQARRRRGHRDLSGVVTDRLTGVRLPAARVTLVIEGDPGPTRLRTKTDDEGRFRFCDVATLPVSIRARYGGITGPALQLTDAVSAELDLDVPVTRRIPPPDR